jgi:protein involved in polysaccharide export with SLBB domain
MDKSPRKKMQSRPYDLRRFFRLSAIVACLCLLALMIGASARAADAPVTAPPTSHSSDTGSSASETPFVPSATVSSTYRLAPYDVIDVSVYNEDDLHTRARLGADGTALLPLIGSVPLAGKTVTEANDLIRDRYSQGFVKDPNVLLTVVEYRKSTFSILGQVERPGIYEIPEGTHLSIVDAILFAGGFTRIANQNGVSVKRLVKGKSTIFKVKAGAMADSSDVVPFEILPGDVIKVNESWW